MNRNSTPPTIALGLDPPFGGEPKPLIGRYHSGARANPRRRDDKSPVPGMNRRKLLASLGAGAFAATFSLAQSPERASRVGFLMLSNRAAALDPGHAGAFAAG